MNPRLKILFYATAIICVVSIVLNVFQAFCITGKTDKTPGTNSEYIEGLKKDVEQSEKNSKKSRLERDSVKKESDKLIKRLRSDSTSFQQEISKVKNENTELRKEIDKLKEKIEKK